MAAEYERLRMEIEAVESGRLEAPGACNEWSVKDLLAHLNAWHEMFLGWEVEGRAGRKPEMPAPGFGWGDTPALNAAIWERTRDDSWEDVAARLDDSYRRVRSVIESYEDPALFEKRRFAWTGSTSVGSYAVSATSSHYDWARKLIRKFRMGS